MHRIRKILITTVLVSAVLALPAAHAEAPKMKPGLWETTVTVEMVGAPAGMPTMPPQTERRCVRASDLDEFVPQSGAGKCDVKKQQKNANTMTWTVKCSQDGMVSTGHGQSTVSGDTNDGFFEITMSGGKQGPMTMRSTFTSHRLGGC
jgi:hypothetical protein